MTTTGAFQEETLKDASDYADLASQSPLATAFHRPEWLAAVEYTTGKSVRLLRVLQGKGRRGIFRKVLSGWGRIGFLPPPPAGLGMNYSDRLFRDWGNPRRKKGWVA